VTTLFGKVHCAGIEPRISWSRVNLAGYDVGSSFSQSATK